MKVRKAIIPAAGLGTRLLPNTKSIPKEMLPLVDKPVIQYIVEEAVSAGVEEILIITNICCSDCLVSGSQTFNIEYCNAFICFGSVVFTIDFNCHIICNVGRN